MYNVYLKNNRIFFFDYFQFNILMKAHSIFNVFRRFFVVRARFFLFKQQRVTTFEKQFEELNLQKSRSLYFDNFHANANVLRLQIFKNFDEALRNYDKSYVRIFLMSFNLNKTAIYKTSMKNEDFLKMRTFNELF